MKFGSFGPKFEVGTFKNRDLDIIWEHKNHENHVFSINLLVVVDVRTWYFTKVEYKFPLKDGRTTSLY